MPDESFELHRVRPAARKTWRLQGAAIARSICGFRVLSKNSSEA